MAHVEVTQVHKSIVVRIALAASVLMLVLAAVPWVRAQGGAVQEAEAPVIALGPESTPDDVPQQVSPGYTLFALEGPADNGATLTLFRLKSGATVEALRPALEAVDRAFSGGENPTEAINAALEIADVVVELDLEAGLTQSVGVVLAEGEYVLDHAPYPTEEGALPERTLRPFTVSGEVQSETPTADVEVQMVDFAFGLPPGIGAGEQRWRVTNAGQQLHHMAVFRLNEGATVQDVEGWLETEEGPPPGDPAAYVGIMSPGYSADYTLELTPGRYVAICFMPDHRGDASGRPHFMLGMIQEFEIAGP